jgi:PAS domain S-box-containing protein
MVPDTERHEELLQTLDTAARQSPWPAWVWSDLLPGGLMLNQAARHWLGLQAAVDQPLMAQALSGRQPQPAPLPWLTASTTGHLGAQEWPDGELTWLRLPPGGPQGWYVRLWPRAELPAPAPLPPREDRFRLIIESALTRSVNGVVVTDATLPGNPIVHVTPGFTRLTGYNADEVIGRNCGFLQGSDRAQAGVFQLREAIAQQRDCTVVLRNFRKDGTPFWNQVEMHPVRDDATGLVTHFFALQTDVTLRKEAEEAALVRHIELERVFAGSPMALLTLDAQQCVQMASPAFERLFGTRLDAIKGCPRDELPRHLPLLATQPSSDPSATPPWTWPEAGRSECWHVGGASPRALEVSVHPLGGPSPEQLYLFRDVTQSEEQQQAHSEFLAKAAHELRTPLGSICGFTELLLSRAYTREQQRPLLETVLSQAMRLTSLINDLLDLSRMDHLGEQAFPLRAVDLRGVMHKALQVVQTPGGGRSFDVQWPPAGPLVWGHAQKLEQVLINLLSNAVKYSPDGGAVHVRALPDPIPGSWRIEIEDHGIGLSPEHLDKLFTRFFRANPSGPIPGTGLGLVIVKELVERMGGQVTVRSTLGQGTTFSVHLSPLPDVAPASSSSS